MPYLGHMAIPEWTLADRLRKARTAAGMEQTDLAEELGASRSSIVNYETGRTSPRPYMLREWARITEVPASWLLDGDVTREYRHRRLRAVAA